MTVKSIFVDVLTWIGLGPIAKYVPLPALPLPNFVEAIWIGVREFNQRFNNQQPKARPTITGQGTDGTITGNLNAVDFDGDTLTFTAGVAKNGGMVHVAPDGSFTYTPSPELAATGGVDTFRVQISDSVGNPWHMHGLLGALGLLGPITKKVTVRVDKVTGPVDHSPEALDPPYTITGTGLDGSVYGQVNVRDADTDTGTLIFGLAVPVDSAVGIAIVGSNGAWTFTPTPQARYHASLSTEVDIVDFAVRVSDGTSIITIPVTVQISPLSPDNDGTLDPAELEDLVASGLVAVIENENGTLRVIDGRFSDNVVHSTSDAAEVLNQISGLLGASPGFASSTSIDTQTVTQTTDTGEVIETFYRLNPVIDGIAVLGSQVVLSTDGSGRVTGVISGYNPGLAHTNTVPDGAVDADAAVRAATEALLLELSELLDGSGTSSFLQSLSVTPELIIYAADSETPPRLAWQVVVYTAPASADDELGQELRPYISAVLFVAADGSDAGSAFASLSSTSYAWTPDQATLQDLNGRTRTINVERDGLTYRLHDSLRGIWTYSVPTNIITGVGSASYPGPVVTKNWYDLGWNTAATTAQANVGAVYDYYRLVLSRNSYDNMGSVMKINMNFNNGNWEKILGVAIPSKQNNAAWDNVVKQLFFYDGVEMERALDVVAHEFTHAVYQSIVYSGKWAEKSTQAAALNEAYADIIGSLIENKNGDDRWIIGEDMRLDPEFSRLNADSGGKLEAAIRDMRNEPRSDLSNDSTDEHALAQKFSHAAYEMMAQLGGQVPKDKWSQIFYNSLYRLPTNPSFLDARAAVIGTAKAYNLSSTQINVIKAAFDSVGISDPSFVRIVLHWGATPADLDSHLTGPTTNGGSFHVYYASRTYTPSGTSKAAAELDYDDTSSFGPETTTIRILTPGDYYFYVHDFSNGSSDSSRGMALSGANIRVYNSTGSISQRFDISPTSSGTYWTAFKLTIRADRSVSITPINQYGTSPMLL
ncbi:hypothetical protein BRW64_23255 [Mycolicibacterium diernhoferi]|uniref:Peptidase M4 n=1 Tax=Mycolicibacterium diernhoferi TaxID=1801 RepID=A0A1Q4H6V3_9MYCO|nr:hypothetical protein BRW64_23255 [Mycolicibacterium diernhoferi]OPE53931.1 hypothetical protein BV510_12995 [Mycolicibacterium diernhoferi]